MAPTPSAQPSPTPAPSPSPPLSPSPLPTPDAAARAIIERFVSDFIAKRPDFHVVGDVEGAVSAGPQSYKLTATMDGDVSGDDFAGSMVLDAPLRGFAGDVVIADGDYYIKAAGGEGWLRSESFEQTQPINPFTKLRAGDLAYVGTVARAGRALHILRTTTWIGGQMEELDIPNATLERSLFDIYVGEDGIPVEARLDFVIAATVSDAPARLEYHVAYRISEVGEEVTITPPPTIEP
jgi:hypothetical protein